VGDSRVVQFLLSSEKRFFSRSNPNTFEILRFACLMDRADIAVAVLDAEEEIDSRLVREEGGQSGIF